MMLITAAWSMAEMQVNKRGIPEVMENIRHKVQFCVVGGGLAGMCAALAAARHGIETVIMHERPVFGGNASSEVRMWVCGSYYDRETGIVEELRLENLYRNTYPNYSIWDSILYEKMRFQKNLTCLLNCSCYSLLVKCDAVDRLITIPL